MNRSSLKGCWVLGERGQAVAFDMAFALFMFLIALGFVFGVWNNWVSNHAFEAGFSENAYLAERAVDALARTPGSPADWDSLSLGSANFLGLADRPLVLDPEKTARFFSLPPDSNLSVAEKLGVGGKGFFVRLHGVGVGESMGSLPGGEESVFSAERVVLYNGGSAFLEVRVY